MGDLSVLEAVGIVAGIVAIMLAGMFVMLKLAYNIGINNKILRDLVDRFDKLPCAERKEEITEIKSNIVEMKSDIVEIKSDIVIMKSDIVIMKSDIVEIKADIVVIYSRLDTIEMLLVNICSTLEIIKSWIVKLDISMIDAFPVNLLPIRKNSPKALTDFGHEIMRDINGMIFLEEHKDFLFDLIDKEKPKTALDVESSAHSVCFMSTGNDIFNPIKNWIYQASPIKAKNRDGEEIDFSIDIFYLCYVLSIPLRDMYLLEHPSLLEQLQ